VKKKAIDKRIRELETAKQRLAKMNIYEDVKYNEMEDKNLQHLSAAVCKRARNEIDSNSEEGEVFNFVQR